ncbi:MepB family protein [Exiguobacterium antarcticum]|uniref:MepB family protein n=1 Tax=Exiguobacterium antarcticum TaxID=132920 RepID=A0ABT6R349_9BACL|nr:MepB family protein [Exiguobacterium antarcticum]MDI3235218.1 MepB family protein [Exiguobacterium antarcticum]
MQDFFELLNYVNKIIYEPNRLPLDMVQEEPQNSNYGAGTFKIFSKTVRFRVAHVTPTKLGQFVVFWEKDNNNKNQPYPYDEAPDLLVITTFKNDTEFGQFIFPKEVLLKQNILASDSTQGKMAMRVYPSWDTPTSKQAIATQKWQVPYFIDMRDAGDLLNDEIVKRYSL